MGLSRVKGLQSMRASLRLTRTARGFPGNEGVDWERPGRKTRAVRECLDALDNDSEQITTHEATRKAISLTDPSSCWTSSAGGPAFYAYSMNYLIDTQCAIIVDARGCSATLSQEGPGHGRCSTMPRSAFAQT
ncbi:MAG: hypothetical protein ACI8XZ_005294 [Gammaproteobacteria bacterium]|jgi:hypothetical protein